jgi:hypothetical protein
MGLRWRPGERVKHPARVHQLLHAAAPLCRALYGRQQIDPQLAFLRPGVFLQRRAQRLILHAATVQNLEGVRRQEGDRVFQGDVLPDQGQAGRTEIIPRRQFTPYCSSALRESTYHTSAILAVPVASARSKRIVDQSGIHAHCKTGLHSVPAAPRSPGADSDDRPRERAAFTLRKVAPPLGRARD